MRCWLCGSRFLQNRSILLMKRVSAGAELEALGVGRLTGEPFCGPCFFPFDCLCGTGLLTRCFVPLARCSTRILSEPILPAALLTREFLFASTLGPTRPASRGAFF